MFTSRAGACSCKKLRAPLAGRGPPGPLEGHTRTDRAQISSANPRRGVLANWFRNHFPSARRGVLANWFRNHFSSARPSAQLIKWIPP